MPILICVAPRSHGRCCSYWHHVSFFGRGRCWAHCIGQVQLLMQIIDA